MKVMTTDLPSAQTSPTYRERLVPGPGIFIAVLLVVPAVALVMTPIDRALAWPLAVTIYVIIALTMLLLSPKITVENGTLTAGHASIPASQLGAAEALGADGLRAAIGPGLDARSYLLVRGWIHRGVRIENIDANDPAPYWIMTTRHPERLINAIQSK